MLSTLLGQTCQVFRPTKASDGFGDPRDKWSATPDATYPCRLQHAGGRSATEDTDGRDVALGQWIIYLPANATLSEHDRLSVDGKTFEVTGVYPVPHPRTGQHHIRATLHTFGGVVPVG